jgi:Nucleotide modification associated domain 2
MDGSIKQAFGDNIYHRSTDTGYWQQANSHHSLEDGCSNPANIENDTKTDRVLLSNQFTYWGGSGPTIPPHFRAFAGQDICTSHPGHKSRFDSQLVEEFVAWLTSMDERGYVGTPREWARSEQWR